VPRLRRRHDLEVREVPPLRPRVQLPRMRLQGPI